MFQWFKSLFIFKTFPFYISDSSFFLVAEATLFPSTPFWYKARKSGFWIHPHYQNLPSENAIVFVVATTGQGEIPPNMRNGWRRLLRRSLGSNWMQNVSAGVLEPQEFNLSCLSVLQVHFAVLGLGDSSYQKYNFAGKKVYRRLLQLGGNCLLDVGLGGTF